MGFANESLKSDSFRCCFTTEATIFIMFYFILSTNGMKRIDTNG